MLRVATCDQYDIMEAGSDSDDNTKRKLGRKNKQHRSNVEEGYQNVLKSFESSLQNINSIVSNSKLNPGKSKLSKKKLRKEEKKNEAQASCQPGRPKMIHTQKTRVPVEIGSDGVKKGQKTKTMVTRTPKVMPNEHKLGIFPGGERNRPRTKNVSYHIEGKLQPAPATFTKPKEEKALTTHQMMPLANIKVEPNTQKVASNNHRNNNGNILTVNEKMEPTPRKRSGVLKRMKKQKHGIKQEPMDIDQEEMQNNNNTENTDSARLMEHAVDGSNLEVAFEASVTAEEDKYHPDMDQMNNAEEIGAGNVKLSVKVESTPQRMLAVHHSVIAPVDDIPETIIPDAVEYTCEMCSAVFSSRAELLVHVPIHI